MGRLNAATEWALQEIASKWVQAAPPTIRARRPQYPFYGSTFSLMSTRHTPVGLLRHRGDATAAGMLYMAMG